MTAKALVTLLAVSAGIAILPASGPTPGIAQSSGVQASGSEATIYRDILYRGPAMAVSRANPDVRLAWPVTSVRVARGAWQLCSEPNFRGTCFTTMASTPNIIGKLGRMNQLRSIRPIAGGGGGGGPGGPGGGSGGRSLRGMAAEFYPAPEWRGSRVLACQRGSGTAACAATTADEFCRNAGWTASAREAMETVNRRIYLADVLCTRTGH
ncbi:beta/gamma crystallin-related protein [Sphingobium aquiterrae]|uniref:beta/gamma crystallin-related protein n=1 Tax=Sphingobium aquiterrae TaxID=2038656 RepID=UPI00301772ED